jgi:hypothetical protein
VEGVSVLRFDGVYVSVREESSSYLRFYADGDVVTVSSTGTPQEVARWLDRTHEKPVRWTLEQGRISFAEFFNFSDRGEPAESGYIRFAGAFEGEALRLRITSDLTGHDGEELYRFVALAFGVP